MTTLEITLLVTIIVIFLAVGALSVPSEKGKQMHEQVKQEYLQEQVAKATKEILIRNAA